METAMKTKIVLMALMIIACLASNHVFADVNELNNIKADKHLGLYAIRHISGTWTVPIPIYIDSDVTIYADALSVYIEPAQAYVDGPSMVNSSFGWMNLASYFTRGEFIATIVVEYKSKKVLKPIIDSFKRQIEKSPNRDELEKVIFPELFKYKSEVRRFYVNDNKVVCYMVQYFDRDGETIKKISEPINDIEGEAFFDVFPPIAKYELKPNPVLFKTANSITKIFKRAMNDPKIAVKVNELKALYRERDIQ